MAFTASSGHTRTSLAEINITPLVDVVLVLLIIFMVTAPVLQSGIDVSVPKTRSVKEITQQRLVLTIDRDQNVFLGDKPVNLAQLPTLLHNPKTDPANQVIYLRADERAEQQHVQECGFRKGRPYAIWLVQDVRVKAGARHRLLLRGLLQGLGHNADIGDPGLFDRIHDRSESAKGDPLVGPQINNLAGWICIGLVQ